MVMIQLKAMRAKRLFAIQAEHIEPLGPTWDNYLFGLQGFFTTDPKNIEFINSTRFEGRAAVYTRWLIATHS